jgi:O-antigen biosynthesis protein WbqV
MIPNRRNDALTLLRYASILLDLAVAAVAFYGAYAVTLGWERMVHLSGIIEKGAAFTALAAISLVLFSVTRGSWRYVSIPDLLALIKASLFAVGVYTIGAFFVSRADNVPRSVPLLTLLFLIAGMATTRLAYRLLMDGTPHPFWGRQNTDGRRKVLLLGLTNEAESFVRMSRRSPEKMVTVVGILDDAGVNQARSVQGVKVFGGLNELQALVEKFSARGVEIKELIVAERKPGRQRLSKLVEAATSAGLKISRIPDMAETAAVNPNGMMEPRPIEIEDLLGRPEVTPDVRGIANLIEGRTIIATGAGGSIGSELCRQIAAFNPRRLIITDSSEFHLYMLDKEMRENYPSLDIVTRLMNVRDSMRVSQLFQSLQPEVVFHAAALKHVPLVEHNPLEAVKTNVLGTRNVADAALAARASAFVMISTDKAVNPRNVMGATKRAAEAYCQALDVASEATRFKTVRFGNVLGSNGSVVPRFQEQIAAGGPVTVTHPDIVRYFMTIPEAVRLVLQASSDALRRHSVRGTIMVLDMGNPVKILDLAERMIQLAGFKPYTDIEIAFTGLRPGEKLYEELFDPSEVQDLKSEEGYVVASPRVIDKALLYRTLEGMKAAIEREDDVRAIELLSHIVPEYRRSPEDSDAPTQGQKASSPPSIHGDSQAPGRA